MFSRILTTIDSWTETLAAVSDRSVTTMVTRVVAGIVVLVKGRARVPGSLEELIAFADEAVAETASLRRMGIQRFHQAWVMDRDTQMIMVAHPSIPITKAAAQAYSRRRTGVAIRIIRRSARPSPS
jgi:hypothetical protein